jgi:hypothetical protein
VEHLAIIRLLKESDTSKHLSLFVSPLLHKIVNLFLFFVDRVSRYNRAKKTNLMHHLSSVYFGPICSPSSGGKPYIYNNRYLLSFLVDCCPGWDSQVKRTINTDFCIYTVYLLMMGYKYARNKLRINGASSWFSLHDYKSLCRKLTKV